MLAEKLCIDVSRIRNVEAGRYKASVILNVKRWVKARQKLNMTRPPSIFTFTSITHKSTSALQRRQTLILHTMTRRGGWKTEHLYFRFDDGRETRLLRSGTPSTNQSNQMQLSLTDKKKLHKGWDKRNDWNKFRLIFTKLKEKKNLTQARFIPKIMILWALKNFYLD